MQEREPRGLHHTENDAGDFAPKQAIKRIQTENKRRVQPADCCMVLKSSLVLDWAKNIQKFRTGQ